MKRITVIGNAGAGKTTLSRILAKHHNLPLTHVDSLQFLPGMKIRPHQESIALLNRVHEQEKWLIEGYGPLDILEKRLELADQIIFIDFPLWRHYWWALKRQIQVIWKPREELPPDCDEASLQQTLKLFKAIWKVHKLMRPEMLRILSRESLKGKVIHIHTPAQFKSLLK